MFHEALDRFGEAPAIIDAATSRTISYAQLETLVVERLKAFGDRRALIFLEARNQPETVIDYLACLRGGHVAHLLDDLTADKTQQLHPLYRPNLVIDASGAITHYSDAALDLHPDLALLLSTSGSTGSPKFVKLSGRNLDANAASICEYLELTASERPLQHLKPHYSYGLSIINSHLRCGAALVLTQKTVLDEAFWAEMQTFQATSFAGVPYTFETLLHRNFRASDFSSLRYATQAGGKLEAGLVRAFANTLADADVRFYVMYGQTEAGPRISYLPPAMAADNPDTIGKAIPGGELYLVDGAGARIEAPDTPGELAYEGPNVMMGYALEPADLATDQTPPRLMTGDIACRRANGLFYIVGRSSRFVKPFGVRVNLDEVQSFTKIQYAKSVATGRDNLIVIAIEATGKDAERVIDIAALAERFALPARLFTVKAYDDLPLLPNGKYDFQRILKDASDEPARPSFIRRVVETVFDVLGLNQHHWNSILEIYQATLSDDAITSDQSFSQLQADSLSFVTLAIELEQTLGDDLPEDWQDLPIRQLDEKRQAAYA